MTRGTLPCVGANIFERRVISRLDLLYERGATYMLGTRRGVLHAFMRGYASDATCRRLRRHLRALIEVGALAGGHYRRVA